MESHFFPLGTVTASVSQYLWEYMPSSMKMTTCSTCIAYLLLCKKLHQILAALNSENLLFLIVSEGQRPRSHLAVCFWLQITLVFGIKLSVRGKVI